MYMDLFSAKSQAVPSGFYDSNLKDKILDINFRSTGNGYKYRMTNATDSVLGIFGQKNGNVSIKSNSIPKIIKTNDTDKPFTLDNDVTFSINYLDSENKEQKYKIPVKKGYKWDGASIPTGLQWAVGEKETPEYAVASMLHDVMCEDHSKIGNNRNLSSNIFRALLKINGTSSIGANIMSWFVDLYQYCFSNWDEDKSKKTKFIA